MTIRADANWLQPERFAGRKGVRAGIVIALVIYLGAAAGFLAGCVARYGHLETATPGPAVRVAIGDVAPLLALAVMQLLLRAVTGLLRTTTEAMTAPLATLAAAPPRCRPGSRRRWPTCCAGWRRRCAASRRSRSSRPRSARRCA